MLCAWNNVAAKSYALRAKLHLKVVFYFMSCQKMLLIWLFLDNAKQCGLETQVITCLYQWELIILDVDILEISWQPQIYVMQILCL